MEESTPFVEDFTTEPVEVSAEVEEDASDEMILALCKEYGEIHEKEKYHTDEANTYKARRTEIEALIASRMAEVSPSIKVKVGETESGKPIMRTVYTKQEVYGGATSPEDMPKLIEAMKNSGLGDMVKEAFNANSFKSYIRGFLEKGEILTEAESEGDMTVSVKQLIERMPIEMQPFVKVTKKIALTSKRS